MTLGAADWVQILAALLHVSVTLDPSLNIPEHQVITTAPDPEVS